MFESLLLKAPTSLLATVVDGSMKICLLALLAAVFLRFAKVRDPNLRHRVWTGVLLAMLAMPVLSNTLPALQLPLPTVAKWLFEQDSPAQASNGNTVDHFDTSQSSYTSLNSAQHRDANMEGLRRISPSDLDDLTLQASSRSPSGTESELDRRAISKPVSDRDVSSTMLDSARSRQPDRAGWMTFAAVQWKLLLFIVWASVAVVMLLRLSFAWLGEHQLRRSAYSIAPADLVEQDVPLELLHFRGKPICLLESARLCVPVTAGVLRPCLYLPAEWPEWSREKLIAVLTHERTHIERWDCAVLLLAELNRALAWFHPLSWWLKRKLSILAEAACDDTVIGATGDRTAYARHLLEVARSSSLAHGRLSPLVASMATRSDVEARIHSILDFTRPLSKRITGVTSVSLLIAMIAIATIAAAIQPANETTSIASVTVSEKETVPVETSKTIHGVVLKPDGTPAAGAIVRSAAEWWNWQNTNEREDPPVHLLETLTDNEGRFSLELPFAPADKLKQGDPAWKDVWLQPPWKSIWDRCNVAASMPNTGAIWVTLKQIGDDSTIRLQLTEEVPIRGTIVNLEGQPVADVAVKLHYPDIGRNGSLDDWLAGIRAGETPWMVIQKLAGSADHGSVGIPREVVTDAQGRFEIRGLGKEQMIELTFISKDVAHRNVTVCTRTMSAIARTVVPSSAYNEPVFGSEFTYSADPARLLKGIVKDAATGQPLSGVAVESYKLDGYPFANYRVLNSVSDSEGKFQIIGMPKGIDNQLIALPPDGMPYLIRNVKVPDSVGLDEAHVEIELHRGVLITGIITDKSNGQPVSGCRLHYLPVRNNSFAIRLPEFSDENIEGDESRYTTDRQGRFQLVGLPGKAIIGAESVSKGFRLGFGYEDITATRLVNSDWIDTYRNPVYPSRRWPNSMKEVDIPADAEFYSLDMELDPGASLKLKFLDEQGRSVKDVHVEGVNTQNVGSKQTDGEITAINFGPQEIQTVIARSDQERIGRVFDVGLTLTPTGSVAIRLQPFASMKGRLMLDELHPASGVEIEAHILPSRDFSPSLPKIAADADGRFKIDLIPGCRYSVSVEGRSIIERVASIRRDLSVEPGQSLELGELILDGTEFVPIKVDEAEKATVKHVPNDTSASLVPQPSEGSSKKGDSAQKMSTTAITPANGNPVGTPDTAASVFPSVIEGFIKDEEGTPVAGVTVAAVGTRVVPAERGGLDYQSTLIAHARTGSDGKYQLKISREDPYLKYLKVVTGGNGFATVWEEILGAETSLNDAQSNAKPKPLTFKMRRAQSINVRLVDVDGRPAVGVYVKFEAMIVRDVPRRAIAESAIRSLGSIPELSDLWTATQLTDYQGRCQIKCLCELTGAVLKVDGSEQFAPQTLMLNSGQSEKRGENDATYRTAIKNVGVEDEAIFTLAPAQIFEGQITLADTGLAASGFKVQIWASQQEFGGSMLSLDGQANELGKYRISSNPGINFGVTAFPPAGQPYLAKQIRNIRWGAGLEPKKVDIAVPRGVLVRGNVIESTSRNPVVGAYIQYIPKQSNPNDSDDIISGWEGIQRTGEDGSFSIAVLPGRGTLVVHGPNGAFVLEELVGMQLYGDKPGGNRNYANAFVPLDVELDASPEPLTIPIQAGRRVRGTLVDENNQIVQKALMITRQKVYEFHLQWRGFVEELVGGRFELNNLAPSVAYETSFLDPVRKLGATVTLRSDEPEPTVVLRPCGSARVRFVTSDGEPREKIHSLLHIVVAPGETRFNNEMRRDAILADEDFVSNIDRVNHQSGPTTDLDGWMELPALIPGATYRLIGQSKGKTSVKDFTVQSGETINLGEIVSDSGLEIK